MNVFMNTRLYFFTLNNLPLYFIYENKTKIQYSYTVFIFTYPNLIKVIEDANLLPSIHHTCTISIQYSQHNAITAKFIRE